MIQITSDIRLDESELEEQFVRALGPGGQHANKAATAVQLRFDVANSSSLPDPVRRRLMRLASNQLTQDGVLVIDARRFRSQKRNREDARSRLIALIRRAAKKPKVRRETKPSRASKERRLRQKKRRSETKRLRRSPRDYE